MSVDQRGNIVLKTIPTKQIEELVISFLLKIVKNASRDNIVKKIQEKPVLLFKDISEKKGKKIAAELTKIGAAAAFVSSTGDNTQITETHEFQNRESQQPYGFKKDDAVPQTAMKTKIRAVIFKGAFVTICITLLLMIAIPQLFHSTKTSPSNTDLDKTTRFNPIRDKSNSIKVIDGSNESENLSFAMKTISVDPELLGKIKARAVRRATHRITEDPIGFSGSAEIYDRNDFEMVIQNGHAYEITDVKMDFSGRFIISADRSGTIKLWDFRTGRLLGDMEFLSGIKGETPEKAITQIAIDPFDQFIAAGCYDGKVRIWEMSTGKPIDSFCHMNDIIKSLAIDSSGQFLVYAPFSSADRQTWEIAVSDLRKSKRTEYHRLRLIDVEKLSVDPTRKYIVVVERPCVTKRGDSYRLPYREDERIGERRVPITNKNRDEMYIRIMNFETGETLNRFKSTSLITDMTLDPSGRFIIYSTKDRKIRMRDLLSGEFTEIFETHSNGVWSDAIVIDPTGQNVISLGNNTEIVVWSLSDKKVINRISTPIMTTALTVDPTGRFIVTGDKQGSLKIWGLRSGKNLQTTLSLAGSHERFKKNGIIKLIADNKGEVVVLYDGREIKVWDIHNGRLLKTYEPHPKVKQVAFDPSCKRFYTSSDNKIYMHDLKTGLVLNSMYESHDNRRLEWHHIVASGNSLLSRYRETKQPHVGKSTWRIWDLETGTSVDTLKSIDNAIIDERRKYAAFVRSLEKVELWDLENREFLFKIEINGKPKEIIIDSKNQIVVLVDSKSSVKIFNLESGHLITEIRSNLLQIDDADLGPNGKFLIIKEKYKRHTKSTSEKEPLFLKAALFRVDNGELLFSFSHEEEHTRYLMRSIKIDPTGRYVVSTSGHRVYLHEIETNMLKKVFRLRFGVLEQITFAVKGRYLIGTIHAGPLSNPIYIWDLDTCELMYKLFGHLEDIFFLSVWSGNHISDKQMLISASKDGYINLWDLKSGELMKSVNFGRFKATQQIKLRGDLLFASGDGLTLNVWNINKNESFSLLSKGNEWIQYTADGYFDSSRYGGSLVSMVKNRDAFSVDQFALINNRPDIIFERTGIGSKTIIDDFYNQYKKRVRRYGFSTQQLSGSLHVPFAEIIDTYKKGGLLNIRFRLSDTKYNLKQYHIYSNDVPLFEANGKEITGNEVIIEEKVELLNGKNKIEISCLNEKGAESFRATTWADHVSVPRGDLYFIGFGVSKYKDTNLNLEYADKDVMDLADMFSGMKGIYNDIYVHTYVNEEVTKENIQNAKQFLEGATIEDTLVLFIAGHGLHDTDKNSAYYYLTYNSEIDNLAETSVNFETIEKILYGIKPRRKLFLMDTCESGELDDAILNKFSEIMGSRGIRARTTRAITTSSKGKRSHQIYRNRFIYNDLIRRSGAIVFSSSLGGEFSYESNKLKNGLFTEEIINAFSDSTADKDYDKKVSTDELHDYVTQKVVGLSNGFQHPSVDRDNIYQKIYFPTGRH